MTVDAQSASPDCSTRTPAERDRDVLYLIGRGLIDHKERLYTCHQTGLTAEVAWPIMESILGYIRPFLKYSDPAEAGLKLLPTEPTAEMVSAALQASILLRQQHEQGDLQPDSPGWLPYEMVRTVWHAMLRTLPPSFPAPVVSGRTVPPDAGDPAASDCPVAFTARSRYPGSEAVHRIADSVRIAVRWVFHFPKHALVKQ